MKLIYHAHVFEYIPRPIRGVKPQAINWRFQRPGEKLDSIPRPLPAYVKPKAMNWKFELAANPNLY